MGLRTRLEAVERHVPRLRDEERCSGCGQRPEERIPWAFGAMFPNCTTCGAAIITLEMVAAHRVRCQA